MNQRIRELYRQSIGKDWAYDFDPEVAEKFALLIVEESCRAMQPHLRDMISRGRAQALIREHFASDPSSDTGETSG